MPNNLIDKENNLDDVTKLNLMPFFTSNYNIYLNKYPNSNLVFIDFAKLKRINDEFTHQGGNACLNSFGKILKAVFFDSLIARKHGDEFLILTHHNYKNIQTLLDKVNEDIQNHFDLDLIPAVYGFNAGVVPAEHGINPTIEKADIMMYEAKKRGLVYLNFESSLYNKVKEDQEFIKNTSKAIKDDELKLAKRTIFNTDKTPTNILDIHTRNKDNQSIFINNRIKLLEESSELKKLDYLNLKKIIVSSAIPVDNKIMINIHANSLFNAGTPFPRFINALYSIMPGSPSNYIICVNVNNFNDKINELIDYFKLMKELGFETALSGLDLSGHNPLLNIWPHTDAKFVKINPTLWKESENNLKYQSLLKNTLPSFLENETVPIFMRVEDENDLDFIRKLAPKSLVEGDLVEKEKEIILKKL